jgi:hypothetical protein
MADFRVRSNTDDELASVRGLFVCFSIYLILLAAVGPGVYSASNRNEYQKQERNSEE